MNVFHNFKATLSLMLAVILIGLSFPVPSQATMVATAVINKGSYKSWTITCAEADTSGTITHGFVGVPPTASPSTAVAPDMVIIVPVNATIAAAGTVNATTAATAPAQPRIFQAAAAENASRLVPGVIRASP